MIAKKDTISNQLHHSHVYGKKSAMTPLVSIDKKTQTALLDAVAALARIFWGPDRESSRELKSGSFLRPLEALESRVKNEHPAVFTELKNIIEGFEDATALFHYLEEAYVRLFINSRGGIIAPLYASCYVEGTAPGENAPLMGPPAVLMRRRFESRGLAMSESMHEPPDHLSIELEYLYYLLQKGWAENDSVLLSEAVSFAGEDMLPWVIKMRERIAAESRCRFYPLITSVAVSILAYLNEQSLSA
jgi:TorA-specific chaperone